MDNVMVAFNESLPFDKVFFKADIQGSEAYAHALAAQSLLSDDELKKILTGLRQVQDEWVSGNFKIIPAVDEDIHTANERRLSELIGKGVAGKLHTGRSRNEQIATDMRLWLRDELEILDTIMRDILRVCAARAEEELDILMPGYTHMQRAQPIRFSHWLLSHATYMLGDLQRLQDLTARVNICPLGAGALAGNPFGIDRTLLAQQLGFQTVHPNSLAAVADRDFVVETLQWASLLMVHLSRLSEDLILYSTAEFGFVQVADAYSTGSSLMPQKKNPDSLELIRGKAGRILGHVSAYSSHSCSIFLSKRHLTTPSQQVFCPR
jgi:argininosuccinate lyase